MNMLRVHSLRLRLLLTLLALILNLCIVWELEYDMLRLRRFNVDIEVIRGSHESLSWITNRRETPWQWWPSLEHMMSSRKWWSNMDWVVIVVWLWWNRVIMRLAMNMLSHLGLMIVMLLLVRLIIIIIDMLVFVGRMMGRRGITLILLLIPSLRVLSWKVRWLGSILLLLFHHFVEQLSSLSGTLLLLQSQMALWKLLAEC